MTRLSWLGATVGLLLAGSALADTGQPVTTLAAPVSGGNSEIDGTIGATGTWQLVYAAATIQSPRSGCLVQDTDATGMRVAFVRPVNGTTTAPASTTAGFPLQAASAAGSPGGWINCATGSGGTLQDAIYIIGTTGATYRAQQE